MPLLTRVSPQGAFLASTLFGGGKAEGMEGIAVDPQGEVWVSGFTYSPDVPLTPDALQSRYRGKRDALAVCLTGDLQRVRFATLLGGRDEDSFRAVAVDPLGAVALVGMVLSCDWPWVHAQATQLRGGYETVVVRLVRR